MVIFRLIGFLLIVFALMLLGADLVSTLEKHGGTVIRSLDQILMLLNVDASPWLEQKLPPQGASAAMVVLSWPGWAVLGVPGIMLGMLSSGPPKKRPPPPAPPPISR
ncbi:MAG TPA: hypothetical protein VNH44_08290 [Micropepsaceae bacterium]|nr:hypothetical protein [Micropepsaceae bacterium]